MSSPVRESRSLIPGLPDEVALIILARLPRALYGNLSRVCYAWRDALRSSSAMTTLRNSLHISEMWLLLLCWSQRSITLYDPLLRHHSSLIPYYWERRSLLTTGAGAVGSQVYFVHEEEGSADIRCFDASSMHWQVDSIPLWGKKASVIGVACSVVDGHLWLVGEGADGRSAMRLDVKSRRWEKMPKMHEGRVRAAAVVLDGRLHVIGGRSPSGNMVHSGEIWDPSTGEWILQPELWPHQLHIFWAPDVVVVMDTLYALKGYKDAQLIHYVSKSKIWASLGHLPLEEVICSCGEGSHPRLEGVGRELWVVLNCESRRTICTAKILSCVPATGSLPLLWRSVSINSPGYVIVNGQVHV